MEGKKERGWLQSFKKLNQFQVWRGELNTDLTISASALPYHCLAIKKEKKKRHKWTASQLALQTIITLTATYAENRLHFQIPLKRLQSRWQKRKPIHKSAIAMTAAHHYQRGTFTQWVSCCFQPSPPQSCCYISVREQVFQTHPPLHLISLPKTNVLLKMKQKRSGRKHPLQLFFLAAGGISKCLGLIRDGMQISDPHYDDKIDSSTCNQVFFKQFQSPSVRISVRQIHHLEKVWHTREALTRRT